MRSVRPMSGTCWGVHTGPMHSNMSESGDVRLVVHCRSARDIGRKRASGGPRLVITHENTLSTYRSSGYLTASSGLNLTVRD